MHVVAHNGARIWGGAERAIALLLAGLQRRGHRVLLLCNDREVARRAAALGVPTELLALGGDGMLPHAFRLARRLRQLRPDAFIIGTYKKLFLAALGAKLARVPRIVARVGLETDTPRSAKYRFALPRWVDAVVVNARRMRPAFADLPGFDADRVVVIHNGVEPPVRRAPRGSVRAALGIPGDAHVVGAVARLARQKRLDRLLRAVAMLSGVHCVLAGDGEERGAIESLAAELGIADRVHLLGYRDDTADVLDALDVFVVSSDREGLSNAMLEALACGVPVVSTPVSGAEDALEPLAEGNAAGEIVGNSEDEIAGALRGLLADLARRRQMALTGLRRAMRLFSMDAMLRRWEAVLAGRAPSGRAPPPRGRMKLVIQNGSRVWGGNEKWLATLASGLKKRGYDVVVSCPRGAVHERLDKMGIATTDIRPRGVLDVASGVAFARWLRRERPDALLLTSWRPLAWGAWAGRRARVPRIVVRLGIVREHPRRGGRAHAFRRWVDAMIVNSAEIRDVWLRSAPGYPAARVNVVMNGLPTRQDERPALRSRLRAELGVAPQTLLGGGAGHRAPRKGFDLLLRGFAAAALPDARVVIAGGGEYLSELREMADTLGISDRAHFLGHRDDGPDVIGGCDVFVLGSRNEGMANVMLEAMAAGVPVIATDVSGVRRALGAEDGLPPAGWIVPPDDPDAMAAALREVAGAISARVRERTNEALRRIREHFGVERMVRECEAILFGDAP